MNRRRLSADRWRDLVGQQQRGGLSIEVFCARHGLAASTFFVWRRKLEARAAPAFVELKPALEPAISVSTGSAAHELQSRARIELLLPGGLIVRVREGFDTVTLRRVVEALR